LCISCSVWPRPASSRGSTRLATNRPPIAYALGGFPEPVTAHLGYFEAHGTLRSGPLAPSRSRSEVSAEFARMWTAAYGGSPPDVAARIDAQLARMR
jgi:hypothetical protein